MDEYQSEQIAIVCRLVNFRTSKELTRADSLGFNNLF